MFCNVLQTVAMSVASSDSNADVSLHQDEQEHDKDLDLETEEQQLDEDSEVEAESYELQMEASLAEMETELHVAEMEMERVDRELSVVAAVPPKLLSYGEENQLEASASPAFHILDDVSISVGLQCIPRVGSKA